VRIYSNIQYQIEVLFVNKLKDRKFSIGTASLLAIIFCLDLAQMNINQWGDSWGAGCLVAAIGVYYG